MHMDAWIWWLIAAAVLLGAEMLTGTLMLAMVGAGAGAAAIVAGLGAAPVWQVVAFVVVSLVMAVVVRPLAIKGKSPVPELRTGVEALRGADAIVVEAVSPDGGLVRIGADVWTARPFDGDSTYAPGDRLMVLEIQGATALVG